MGVKHNVQVIDPLDEKYKLPVLETPHFFFKPGEAPEQLETIAGIIAAADCFVLVTAEYNHSIPPALVNMLDHFGGSKYAHKCCGIVTYSPSQWGGMRCAMALRPITSELGCLSVSRICAIPFAHKALTDEGAVADDDGGAAATKNLAGMLNQLEWLAGAMKAQRAAVGVPK